MSEVSRMRSGEISSQMAVVVEAAVDLDTLASPSQVAGA